MSQFEERVRAYGVASNFVQATGNASHAGAWEKVRSYAEEILNGSPATQAPSVREKLDQMEKKRTADKVREEAHRKAIQDARAEALEDGFHKLRGQLLTAIEDYRKSTFDGTMDVHLLNQLSPAWLDKNLSVFETFIKSFNYVTPGEAQPKAGVYAATAEAEVHEPSVVQYTPEHTFTNTMHFSFPDRPVFPYKPAYFDGGTISKSPLADLLRAAERVTPASVDAALQSALDMERAESEDEALQREALVREAFNLTLEAVRKEYADALDVTLDNGGTVHFITIDDIQSEKSLDVADGDYIVVLL